MDFGSINWLAVIVCVVIALVDGFAWYHPKLFYPAWSSGIGRAGQRGNPTPTLFIFTILAVIVEVVSIAFLLKAMNGTTLVSGLMAGFMLWLGLVAPTSLVNKLFGGFGFKVWAIEAGNHLLNFLIFGAILGAWH